MTSLDRRLPPGFLEEALRADARTGLTAEPKSLPPKWFYDAQGSALFDKITELPEYYPTRAEREILRASAAGIAVQTGARTLIGLGVVGQDPATARRAARRRHAALLRPGRRQRARAGHRREGAVGRISRARRPRRGVRLRGAARVPRGR
jgi:L-histidine N-alpha-methyltransferase